jgi:glycosyltransferase involved in cell wall biosynthesis
MVILEAWAYGKPVLMTPECNLPEGFSAEAALRIETNAESIADGLGRLFEMSPTDRIAMGTRGLDLVKDRFVWSKIAPQMKSVYEWMLGGGPNPPSLFA